MAGTGASSSSPSWPLRQRPDGIGDRPVQDRAHQPARPWKTLADVELATAEYIDWFNSRRLHGAIGHIPPAEHEASYYAQTQAQQMAAAKN